MSHSRARGLGFDNRSGHIPSFLITLIQEGQLSVTGESMCSNLDQVLVKGLQGLSLSRKSVVRLTDHPDMTLAAYCGCKTTTQQQQLTFFVKNVTSFCSAKTRQFFFFSKNISTLDFRVL